MPCRGWFTSLDDSQSRELLASPDAVSFLNSLFERLGEDRILSVDKSWDAMHRCLCGGWLDAKHGEPAMRSCVIGGKQLEARSGNYIISFVPAANVSSVVQAIRPLTKDWFRKAYFDLSKDPPQPKRFLAFLMPAPHRYEGPLDENDFGYTWAYFEEVREFYNRAATSFFSTVFCVDQ